MRAMESAGYDAYAVGSCACCERVVVGSVVRVNPPKSRTCDVHLCTLHWMSIVADRGCRLPRV